MKVLLLGEVSGLPHVAALALCPWPKGTGGSQMPIIRIIRLESTFMQFGC